MLVIIWEKSRYLVQIVANSSATQVKFIRARKNPGIASKATQCKGFPTTRSTSGKMTILCPKISKFRQIMRNICTNKGRGSCFIIPSAAINPRQPSVIIAEIKDQRIMPMDRKGKNSLSEELKICPKTTPIVPIIIPMLMVSQNGPRAERL